MVRYYLKRSSTSSSKKKKSPSVMTTTASRRSEDEEEDEGDDEQEERGGQREGKKKIRFPALPHYIFDGRTIMLNIGGVRNAEGWINVNSKRDNYNFIGNIDVIRPMHHLKGFDNNSVAAIYSSHTLEHTSYGDQMILKTLSEWFRVLRPGGILLLSVPDLITLSKMYLDPSFTSSDRWVVTNMIYGGQADEGDYHHIGFNEELLVALLLQTGFCNITRVSGFNLGFYDKKAQQTFYDTSEKFYKGYFVSLNLVAKVCPTSKLSPEALSYYDGFSIDHNAMPYFGDHLPDLPSTSTSTTAKRRKRPSKTSEGSPSSQFSLPSPASSPVPTLTSEQIQILHQYFQNHEK